jgi:cytochrome c oxidase subunit 2
MHVHRYEKAWAYFSLGLVLAFFLALVTAAFAGGVQVPGPTGIINPAGLAATDFAQPGLRQLAPGEYEVYMVAQFWQWTPNEIRVPQGARVKFYLTSGDVQHGFKVQGTTLNAMVIPGQVTYVSHRFKTPGEYLIVCHEYCGSNHHLMSGKIIVEAPTAATTAATP